MDKSISAEKNRRFDIQHRELASYLNTLNVKGIRREPRLASPGIHDVGIVRVLQSLERVFGSKTVRF
jgi:hypothetical protein